MKPLRTTRLILCGFFDYLEHFSHEAAELLAVKKPVAFQNNEELDASFTEGDYSGKRATFLP